MKKFRINHLIISAFLLLFSMTACRREPADSLNIEYEKYVMPNGLQVILHTDHSDPMIAYVIMYHVGSSREVPGRTGFAHLFEHLLFTGSENVKPGEFDMILEASGGSNNGFTSRDITTYFEEFPKNALEKVLWLESDRMGFFVNSITQRSFAIQQNVVQNEKRQGVDNQPYGFTSYVINKNLYPEHHPYNWDVIGEMEDLRNATLDDAKNFYESFYGPNNATLILSGDFNPDSAKILIEKYFGEIKAHGNVEGREPMIPLPAATVKLYHEDNFANVPEINMVWPVPQAYHKDAYALDFLASILADGKKAPLYKVLVKEKQLTSETTAYNSTGELASEFTITIRANEGKNLMEIEDAVAEAFKRFETDGISGKDIERIRALSEKRFYEGLNSVLNKSIQLAAYNTMLNDPGFAQKDIENIRSVTADDVKRVYETYIKGRPHVVTSFVPKGNPEMIAENSVRAGIEEENINEASQVEIADFAGEEIVRTGSAIDRTAEPPSGKEPEVAVPDIWKEKLSNGIKIYGIYNPELPLVNVSLTIDGGMMQDRTDLPGVAGLVAALLPQGTANLTPEELEEETELLGSDIRVRSGREEMMINMSALSRNFGKTMSLVKEILLHPRWDSTEFELALTRTRNRIIQSEAQPSVVANLAFYRLLYGKDHIFGYSSDGTRESIDKISISDLRSWYASNVSPSNTRIHIAGNITREQALEALKPLEKEWKYVDVKLSSLPSPVVPEKSKIYFIDIPGSRQSVIYIGYPAISRDNPDFIRTEFINYRLGGAFTSILMQILREEKGFTYGARSSFQEMKSVAPFAATASVRSDATLESVEIFKDEMEKYRNGVSEDDLLFIKNSMIRSNALRFETNSALVNMLATLSKYGLSDDYVRKEQEIIRNMTTDKHRAIVQKYIIPGRMYYLVVGDAATQLKPLDKIGFGTPELISR
ncbi:MAG: pitrilysin family protein [Bacteroidales bacterium]|jgi:zinc protease|nr:pitrilysin family protein [Bacteroidales bacterium]